MTRMSNMLWLEMSQFCIHVWFPHYFFFTPQASHAHLLKTPAPCLNVNLISSHISTLGMLQCQTVTWWAPLSLKKKICFSGRLFFLGGCTKAMCQNVLRFHMHDSTVLISGLISRCQPRLSLTYLLAPWSSGQLQFIPFPHPGLSTLSEGFAGSRPASVKIKAKVPSWSFTQYALYPYGSGWPKRAVAMMFCTQMK